jgi:hypothetical protein
MARKGPPMPIRPVLAQSSGNLGESLTAFLLEKECRKTGLTVLNVGPQAYPFDLFVVRPARGRPFKRHTAMMVKTITQRKPFALLRKRAFLSTRRMLGGKGVDLWISLVDLGYSDRHLSFKMYLVPGADLDGGDFVKRKAEGKDVEYVETGALQEKARMVFTSGRRRNERSLDDGDDEGGLGRFPDPRDVRINAVTIGTMGEDMVRYLLEAEYPQLVGRVGNVTRSMWPYDLLVEGPAGGTPFGKRAAISVKTRSERGNMPPGYETLQGDIRQCDVAGSELWLALVHYYYKPRSLAFGMFLTRAKDLRKEDFREVPGWGWETSMLRVKNMRKKARLRLWSGD